MIRSSAAAREAVSGLKARVCTVLGSQWGDEGKGKLVDILAKKYVAASHAIAKRCRGGA
jgi:adenylosuccinate synthase